MLCSFLLLALLATVQGRAVNISNTWVLPEEGFPVFYRYFRDRISWYEADAVCQFHHANLVTVDTTAQYDAVRAYLKELDISSAVWVGLIRSNPDGDFTWTDYRGLSGDGYWSSAPDARSAPLCAAADPAADYRWEARACGGPTVASFICELPVPQWALGNEGCMVRALPALTVLYLPESAAVQLTADCGLAGVKRVQCTGNVKHEELLKDLSCFEEDESSSPPSITSTTTNWVISEVDQETFNDSITEENVSTEHENDFSGLNSISSTPDLFKHIAVTQNKLVTRTEPVQYQDNKISLNKNINLDVIQHNNLQSNDIPKLPDHDNFYSNEEMEKQEDNKHLQHKLLHDELARLGNFENIFSQPTDHFVPPLVMAKAKVNNDMNPVSFEEKLAQQHSEHDLIKHLDEQRHIAITESTTYDKSTTEASSTHTSSTSTSNPVKVYDKKEMNKHISPKKYTIKSTDLKNKFTKYIETKQSKIDKTTSLPLTTEITTKEIETTTLKRDIQFDLANEDNTLDLTVLIKEPELNDEAFKMRPNISYNFEGLEMNDTSPNKVENNYTNDDITTRGYEFNNAVTLNDEIIKITLIHDDNDSSTNKTAFEITTKIPIFKDDSEYNITTTASFGITTDKPHDSTTPLSTPASTTLKEENGSNFNVDTNENTNKTYTMSSNKFFDNKGHEVEKVSTERSFTELTPKQEEDLIEHTNNKDFSTSSTVTSHPAAKEINHDFEETDHVDDFERNATETFQEIDDYQSPLLSGANEPPHKPNRSRRPQQPPNRIKKFNPFRILG